MPEGILHRCLHYVQLCFCTWWVPLYTFLYMHNYASDMNARNLDTWNVVMDLKRMNGKEKETWKVYKRSLYLLFNISYIFFALNRIKYVIYSSIISLEITINIVKTDTYHIIQNILMLMNFRSLKHISC